MQSTQAEQQISQALAAGVTAVLLTGGTASGMPVSDCSCSAPCRLKCCAWGLWPVLPCCFIGHLLSANTIAHCDTQLHLSAEWFASTMMGLHLQAVLSCTLQLASSRTCYDHAPFCWSLTAQTSQMLWRQMASYCHAKASLHPMLSLCQCLPVLDDALTVQSFGTLQTCNDL